MHKILVVDDSKVDRRLISGLLDKIPGWEVQCADDAERAMEVVSSWSPELVITDWLMPRMNGLNFIRRMRKWHREIPVILMTSQGGELTVLEALEQGAASYVPKSQLAERLHPTIHQVLDRLRVKRTRRRLMRCMADISMTLFLESDPALILPLVNYVQQQVAGIEFCDVSGQLRIGIALEEVLRNAIYHGSLELSAAEIAEAKRTGDIELLGKQRSQEAPYRDRHVMVRVHISQDGARLVVRDQGPGFDHALFRGVPARQRSREGRGRGLTLVRAFMDEVMFNDAGNEVTLVKLPDRVCKSVIDTISQLDNSGPNQGELLTGLLQDLMPPTRSVDNAHANS